MPRPALETGEDVCGEEQRYILTDGQCPWEEPEDNGAVDVSGRERERKVAERW